MTVSSAIPTLAPFLAIDFVFDWSREMVFLTCGVLGGSVLFLQTAMLLFGFGGVDDMDMDADVEFDGSESAFGFLSVRGVAAFLTFFGISGWGASSAGWSMAATIAISVAAGAAIMLVVGWLFSMQKRLYSEGNLDPSAAVGGTAKVYLRVPARAQGKGKITVSIQGRSEQFDATTTADCKKEIPTGAEVRIMRMVTPGSFEVEAI